jgi:hypothetical protein
LSFLCFPFYRCVSHNLSLSQLNFLRFGKWFVGQFCPTATHFHSGRVSRYTPFRLCGKFLPRAEFARWGSAGSRTKS